MVGHEAAVIVGVAPTAAAQAAAAGPQRIRPHQHFVGLVNGRSADAVVRTACAGPIWPGRTTQPVAGQTFAVEQVPDGGGYNGHQLHGVGQLRLRPASLRSLQGLWREGAGPSVAGAL